MKFYIVAIIAVVVVCQNEDYEKLRKLGLDNDDIVDLMSKLYDKNPGMFNNVNPITGEALPDKKSESEQLKHDEPIKTTKSRKADNEEL